MLLKLYQTGQPILRKTSKPVTLEVLRSQHTQEVIDYMIATLRDAPGVGLAAPQVGEPLQIIIVEDKSKYQEVVPLKIRQAQKRKPVPLKVLVNPKIRVIESEEELWFEGCLSVDGYLAAVPRCKSVEVDAIDRQGNPVSFIANGWQARILQHEMDHLRGILYIDKMRQKSFMSISNFSKMWRKADRMKIEKAFKSL